MKQDLNTVAINVDELCANKSNAISRVGVSSARINSITSQEELDLIAGGNSWGQAHHQLWIRFDRQ